MFQIEMRLTGKANWFRIWESDNGKDCTDYLKSLVKNEDRDGVEYRLIYVKN